MSSISNKKVTNSMIPVYLAYGSLEIACQPVFAILMSFIVYYYTDVIGLDADTVGTIVLISRIIDGLTDLFSGNIIDNTRSHFGHARPWYLWLALPLALSFVLLYTVPYASPLVQYIYIFFSYNLLASIVYTLMNAALGAFPLLLSDKREDRSVMMSVRYTIASIIQFVIMTYSLRIVGMFGNGQSGWIKYVLIMAVLAIVILVIVFAITKENQQISKVPSEKIPIIVAFKLLFQNKYWILAILIQLTLSLLQLTTVSGSIYYAKYYLNDISMQETMSLFNYIPSILIYLGFSFLLNRKNLSKRKLSLLFNILTIIGSLLILFFKRDLLMIIGLTLRGFGFAAVNVLIGGMAIETAVYGEWKTGISIPGMTVTAVGVGQKLGFGIGTALFGIILGLCGYNGTANVQPASAVSVIRANFTVIPIILTLILSTLLYLFKLDYEYPKYAQEIAARKQNKDSIPISTGDCHI